MNRITEETLQQIINFKTSILMKKIFLSYVIDNYAWIDRAYRWTHAGVAVSTFVVGAIDKIHGTNTITSGLFVVLAGITAVMIKVKDYLKFDKIRDLSKSQTVKYKQLYDRICKEVELPTKEQSESDFIYWIGREFHNIEISDPELSNSDWKNFIEYCKKNQIPYETDIQLLSELVAKKSNSLKNLSPLEPPIGNTQHGENDVKDSNLESNKESNIQHSITFQARVRTPSEERDRDEYHNTLKQLDTKKDLQWALQRLKNLD